MIVLVSQMTDIIEIYHLIQSIKINSLIQGAQEAKGVAIVIDVFRAFTTAAIAFTKGAEKIIMVPEISQALELRNHNDEYLCMGELGGVKPKEFDFGKKL